LHTGEPCQASTRFGRPCRTAARTSGFCWIHEPGRISPTRRARQTDGQRSYHERRRSSALMHRETVALLYEAGVSRSEIAQTIGRSFQTVEAHCASLRKEGRIGRRYKPIQVSERTALEIQELWNRNRLTASELAARFGWSLLRTHSVIYRLRADGVRLERRAIGRGELYALISQQQSEVREEERFGPSATFEKGHWKCRSIDAPLTADGFTILDTLADQDDVLAEMGQAA
jgi:transposase